MTYRL